MARASSQGKERVSSDKCLVVSEGKGKRRASSDNPPTLPFVARARGQGKGRVSSNNGLVISEAKGESRASGDKPLTFPKIDERGRGRQGVTTLWLIQNGEKPSEKRQRQPYNLFKDQGPVDSKQQSSKNFLLSDSLTYWYVSMPLYMVWVLPDGSKR